MNEKAKATVLLAVWLIAYAVIGGIVLTASTQLMGGTGMDDLLAILLSVVLTAVIGWLGASWVQSRVAGRLTGSGAATGPGMASRWTKSVARTRQHGDH